MLWQCTTSDVLFKRKKERKIQQVILLNTLPSDLRRKITQNSKKSDREIIKEIINFVFFSSFLFSFLRSFQIMKSRRTNGVSFSNCSEVFNGEKKIAWSSFFWLGLEFCRVVSRVARNFIETRSDHSIELVFHHSEERLVARFTNLVIPIIDRVDDELVICSYTEKFTRNIKGTCL